MTAYCQNCSAELPNKPGDVVGRTSTCDRCGADLHACVQCTHYDPKRYNDCNEPQAERVDDRTKANFCEYLKLRTVKPGAPTQGGVADRASQARAKLDSLFKKPGS